MDLALNIVKRQLTSAYIYLPCRRIFKRPSRQRGGDSYKALNYNPRCPHCRAALLRVGDTFRAPAGDDLAAWRRVERDLARGRKLIRDEAFGCPEPRQKRRQTPKGVHSLFQLPARKRR